MSTTKILKRAIAIAALMATFESPLAMAQAPETLLPDRIVLFSGPPADFDRRLRAIVHDPSLLRRLDQRQLFLESEKYTNSLNETIAKAAEVLPGVFSRSNATNFITSFCIADGKLFFWLPQNDRDVVGWISIKSEAVSHLLRRAGIALEDRIVVWIVPKQKESSALWDEWSRSGNSITNIDRVRTVLKSALHIDDFQALDVDRRARGRASYIGKTLRHSIEFQLGADAMEAEVDLEADRPPLPRSPTPARPELKLAPFELRFSWPPKDEQ